MSNEKPTPVESNVNSDTYSLLVGMIYMFNLILGTGALAMPAVFAKAGWLIGIFVITILCFVSFIQVTFLIEAMANANFTTKTDEYNRKKAEKYQRTKNISLVLKSSASEPSAEKSTTLNSGVGPAVFHIKSDMSGAFRFNSMSNQSSTQMLLDQFSTLKERFEIEEKFELGRMTDLFLPGWQSKLFFITIMFYMYGDLVIYNTMMAKSLRELTCTGSYNCTDPFKQDQPCWGTSPPSRYNAYRIYLVVLIILLLPLTYLKLTKTKMIQIITIILRWAAFISMVGITIRIFADRDRTSVRPSLANLNGFPKMFGICVYAFMCHHSVPSLLTPIDRKQYLFYGILWNYCLIVSCYLIITLTGIFAFETIEDVYTLNFAINPCNDQMNGNQSTQQLADVPVLNIFLPSYPVFTIFSSYTVIALTLINNMTIVIGYWANVESYWLRTVLPLIAIIPPLIISLFTDNVSVVVSYVGSYTGSLLQYVFPSLLAYYSREVVQTKYLGPYIEKRLLSSNPPSDPDELDPLIIYERINPHRSPFMNNYWIYATAVWWTFSIIVVTIDHIVS
ncbi:hypothetical protein BLOT_014977 [Blomia tropicalis]|nr:hypothetical protein BLOT_014977 [Blomia tropicalis]